MILVQSSCYLLLDRINTNYSGKTFIHNICRYFFFLSHRNETQYVSNIFDALEFVIGRHSRWRIYVACVSSVVRLLVFSIMKYLTR